MREIQITLEEKNMRQTSMKSFMKGLEGNKSCDLFLHLSDQVAKGIEIHHNGVKRKRSPFFKMTANLTFDQVAFVGLKGLMGNMAMSQSMAATLIATHIGNDILTITGREEDVFSIDKKIVKDKVATGLVLLRIVLQSLPDNYFRVGLTRLSKKVTQYTVDNSKGFEELMEENEELFQRFVRKMMPLVCEPDDWQGVYGGGYLTESAKKLTPLIKRNLKHDKPDGDIVFDAVNHLQKTPYRVNKKIFEICKLLQGMRPSEMKKVFMKDLGAFDEPCPYDKDLDSHIWEKVEGKKIDPATGKERKAMVMLHQDEDSVQKRKAFFQWVARKDLHRKRVEGKKSLDRSYSAMLNLTEELEKYEEVFWSYGLDRRSRVYPAAMTGINIQGADYQKAVVEFSVGLPLDFDGDGEGGEYAIKKTLCNHWGQDSGNGVKTDKLTRSQAEEWITGASEWIVKCAKDPLNNRTWMKADKPLQFLAAALEWKSWLEYRVFHDDYKFVSHLCDPNDASCSGAQILSAITRDEVGAMHTNLMNMQVQDLYMAVAKKVSENLLITFKEDTLAQDWLGRENVIREIRSVLDGEGSDILGDVSQEKILNNSKLPIEDLYLKVYTELDQVERDRLSLIVRNLVKKPVMVKFYSGTRYGNIEHCNEFIVEKEWEHMFRCDGTGKAAAYMGNLIFDSINQVIAGAGKVMDWFVHVADALGSLNLPVKWTTPVGFKASMKKFSTTDVKLKVLFYGEKGYNEFTLKIPRVLKDEEGNEVYQLDVGKMKSGIAPDIVHSLDASLIMKVSERCKRDGIPYLTMIHDSLGSHCCFSGRFNKIIREEFINIFEEDILDKMYKEFVEQLPDTAKQMIASPTSFGIKRGNFDLKEMLQSEFCFH